MIFMVKVHCYIKILVNFAVSYQWRLALICAFNVKTKQSFRDIKTEY